MQWGLEFSCWLSIVHEKFRRNWWPYHFVYFLRYAVYMEDRFYVNYLHVRTSFGPSTRFPSPPWTGTTLIGPWWLWRHCWDGTSKSALPFLAENEIGFYGRMILGCSKLTFFNYSLFLKWKQISHVKSLFKFNGRKPFPCVLNKALAHVGVGGVVYGMSLLPIFCSSKTTSYLSDVGLYRFSRRHSGGLGLNLVKDPRHTRI